MQSSHPHNLKREKMQTEESQKITSRFFSALNTLITNGEIKGKKTFCDDYGINRRNLWKLEHNHASDSLQLSWLSHLIVDFGVSAEWLMTGKGLMFKKK